MAVAPLSGPFYQAKGYSKGKKGPVRLLSIHTAEGSTTVESLGSYFMRNDGGSSNAGIGQQGQYAEYVTYNNTAWTNPPVNSVSDTLELCAFADWTRDKWLRYPQMLRVTGHWIAWRASVRGIPLKHITDARGKGVVGHNDINDTYGKSSHYDPGTAFPWDVVMRHAVQIAGGNKPVWPGHDVDLGDTGWAVKAIQQKVGAKIDGQYGQATKSRVAGWQKNKRLPVTGIVDRSTWRAMFGN